MHDMRLRTVDDDDEKQEEEAQDKLLLGATLLFTLLLSLSLSLSSEPRSTRPSPPKSLHLCSMGIYLHHYIVGLSVSQSLECL